MAISPSARIHPTAVISAEAEIGDDVDIGAYTVIEGQVRIGAGCVIRPQVFLCGPLTMGRQNQVYSGAVIGERPQHLRYNDEPTGVEIGNGNVIREHVTIHRAAVANGVTRLGDGNFLMAHCHVAHDCEIGNRCILANGALVAGHCVLQDYVYLSGNCAVHQFSRLGRLAFLGGCSGTSKDIPPFIMQQDSDCVSGINVVGMRRVGMSSEQINAVRRGFRILFREGLLLSSAIQRLESELGDVDVIQEMIAFLRECRRGINPMRQRYGDAA
ncbi:MAG: acyl-ACP--UDP-N-acetylglucosamine O-acyltransferase [Gemmataceae bacterium]